MKKEERLMCDCTRQRLISSEFLPAPKPLFEPPSLHSCNQRKFEAICHSFDSVCVIVYRDVAPLCHSYCLADDL